MQVIEGLMFLLDGSITVAISYDPNSEIGLAILKSYVHTMKSRRCDLQPKSYSQLMQMQSLPLLLPVCKSLC